MQEFVVINRDKNPPEIVAGPFKSQEEAFAYVLDNCDRGNYFVTPVAISLD